MPQSLANILVHVIFSTKNRTRLIDMDQDERAAVRGFAWQNGYGAFSIGQSQLAPLKRYIASQKEHHRHKTFQEEFRQFLKRYQVDYDERYVWD